MGHCLFTPLPPPSQDKIKKEHLPDKCACEGSVEWQCFTVPSRVRSLDDDFILTQYSEYLEVLYQPQFVVQSLVTVGTMHIYIENEECSQNHIRMYFVGIDIFRPAVVKIMKH